MHTKGNDPRKSAKIPPYRQNIGQNLFSGENVPQLPQMPQIPWGDQSGHHHSGPLLPDWHQHLHNLPPIDDPHTFFLLALIAGIFALIGAHGLAERIDKNRPYNHPNTRRKS